MPTLPASDWSVVGRYPLGPCRARFYRDDWSIVRIYSHFLHLIGPLWEYTPLDSAGHVAIVAMGPS
eukprot:1063457-Prorocentrum_minimum.AAC.1